MTKQEAKILLDKYNSGEASAREVALLQYWFIHEASSAETDMDSAALKKLMAAMRKEVLAHTKPAGVRLWPRIIGVAAAVAAIAFGIWFYTTRHPGGSEATKDPVNYANDVAPGKNTATLSLAGGKTLTLSEAHSGVIIDASQIKYNDGSLVENGANKVLTLTTPRGGTYQVTLPDGTKVWLNAASSLTYHAPLNDRVGVRKVELVGEAYFEVFRNKLQPFVVNSKKMELTVLGTHFNVSAYSDENNIKATLLEGSVRIANLSPPRGALSERQIEGVTLKPNQQAIVAENSIDCVLVDAEDVVVWKNGKFRFNNAALSDVLKQLSRWYDVEVVYPQGIPDRRFTGGINRNLNASEALSLLAFTKVKFKIEGKKIIVTNN